MTGPVVLQVILSAVLLCPCLKVGPGHSETFLVSQLNFQGDRSASAFSFDPIPISQELPPSLLPSEVVLNFKGPKEK